MVYQPLYATVRDVNGERGTHSRRTRVNWIKGWVNSELGSVLNWEVNLKDEPYPKAWSRRSECRERIKHFKEEDNENKVKYWEEQLKIAEENIAVNKERMVRLDINVPDEIKDRVAINFMGIRFEAKHLALLQKTKMKDMLGTMSIASAFALIPDMNRMFEAEGKEEKEKAVKAFVEKKDRIFEFFDSEDKKLKEEIGDVGN